MKRPRRSKRVAVVPGDLTALAELARGYLHEDVFAEHGSATAAVRAYIADAGDRARLGSDLRRLTDAARSWSSDRLADFFTTTLRSAWAPASLDELRELAAAVGRDV